MPKIVIVGAGPIGCYLAQLLRKEKIDPLLIEEHEELGRPVHCAGLLGKGVFEESRIPISNRCILNKINGAIIHLGEDTIEVKRKEVAYVVDREKFDKNLGEKLNILFETKFLGLERKKCSYIIETDKGGFDADIVVGADGAHSSVREYVTKNNSVRYLKGVQFRMKIKPNHNDMVEVFVKKHYFYWIIPESKTEIRIGVISHNPYQDLLDFMKEKRLKGKIVEKFAGKVLTTYSTPISHERIFLVGESAFQVKPLTYGGIYAGMRGAEILAECIVRRKFFKYSSLWSKRFGKDIAMALKAREISKRLSDDDIKKIFFFAKEKINIIEQKGNFENHFSFIWEFLKDPSASKKLLSILLKIIKVGFQ